MALVQYEGVHMYRPFTVFIALVVGLCFLPQTARAFDVLPSASLIELPDNRSGITLVVRNPRNVDLAISTEIVERFVQEDGTERQEPADDLFLIFPPQAVVPAGGSQALRVQWLAAPPPVSRSFTLYASEIPVDMKDGIESKLQTILRMGASVHVAAAGTLPKPVVAAVTPRENGVSVTLANEGNRFFYIDSLALDFGGKRIAGNELADSAGRTLVPPGGRRTFTIADVSGMPELAAP